MSEKTKSRCVKQQGKVDKNENCKLGREKECWKGVESRNKS